MPTRNVVPTPHQTTFVEQLVNSGRYQNASEVLREGLRLVEQREHDDAVRLKVLREAVVLGIEDIKAGCYTAMDSTADLCAYISTLTKQALQDH